MERRVLLAIFLAFLTLYLWQRLVVPPQPKPATGGTAAGAQTPQASATQAPATAAPSAAPAVPVSTAAALVGESVERDIRIENADVIATFTNRGARLKSWRLKHYVDRQNQPVELVVTDVPSAPLPFSLKVDDATTTATLNGALYTVMGGETPSTTAATHLAFEYRDAAGLRASKEFTLDPTSFVLSFRADVSVGDRALMPTIEWGPGLGDPDTTTGRYAVKPGGLAKLSAESKPDRYTPAAIAKQPAYDGDFAYAGIEDHYFLAIAVKPGTSKVIFQPVSIPAVEATKQPQRDLMAFALQPSSANKPVKFYVGPKDFDRLATITNDPERLINFGMWAFIIVPLLRALTWINGYVGNYGWSIIILTVIINGIMFPLRHKSVVSMRKMQEIQPEAKAIQDRYAKLKATDPAKQKMNQELMALYRERGVNPASGCIPMVLTFPVLFAFYSLLTTAIELRGAPFTLWIHDLSLPDPLYVTPVLMGVSQLWQQWIAPATGVDPAQRKMMMVMPLVFTFIFVQAPAGAVLYWLVSNLWAIGQQYLTNYLIGPPKVHAVRPAAERRLKRVGGSKTEAAAREN